ncbi:MAG: helicase-exonuclease AddAB subunit AddA [Lachnospiraceae bacterium]|nr:helicase-exonuclease AddAB subunit AddA [Lachnospiraceae bacterium]
MSEERTWTTEQARVIESRNKNLLVSAAAGSGKTAVLTARIVGRLLDTTHPVEIDRLLVLTFTNAAAAEMRERIQSAIEAALEKDSDNAHLKKQETLLHHAQITTYDSFCLFLVRNYFHKVELSPAMRVADPGETLLIAEEVLDEVFADFYEEDAEDFSLLLESYSRKRNDHEVKDMVRRLSTFAQSHPAPLQWLGKCRETYQDPDGETFMKSPLFSAWFDMIRTKLSDFAEELSLCEKIAAAPDGPNVYVDALHKEAEEMKRLSEAGGYPELAKEAAAFSFRSLPAARNYTGDPLKKDSITKKRDNIKKEFNNVLRLLQQDMTGFTGAAELTGQTAGAMIRLTEAFLSRLRARKKEKNVLDFSDMEAYALEILTDPATGGPSDVAKSYRDHFEEIMVDEYQDSNALQEAILSRIARTENGRKNLFFVGDVKQSIYRFRLARPELFMDRYRAYPVDGAYEERIDLHKNFRSRPEVLSAVNDICYRLMEKDIGMVSYDAEVALYPGAVFPETTESAVRMLLAETGAEALAEAGIKDPVEAEARMIASEIKRLRREEHVTDAKTGELREIAYGDIVILLRSPGTTGDALAKVFASEGIPAQVGTTTGYFDAPEVQTMLSFLSILDNPMQDIPMAAVLRSPIGGFSDDDLAAIRSEDPEAFFYVCAQKSPRTRDFFGMVEGFRDRAKDTPIHELITEILRETGYLDDVTAQPGGERKRANLEMLVEKAVAYEKTSYHGLYHFVRYIEKLRKYEVEAGGAELTADLADAVRIMSIHKSKGLEFPVVFVSLLGKQFNRNDEKNALLIHPEYGLGLQEVDVRRHTRRTTMLGEAIAQISRAENMGEELRVLYVAMTRAKEKLIFTAGAKDAATLIETERAAFSEMPLPEGARLPFSKRFSAGSFLALLLPACFSYPGRYEVRLVTPEMLAAAETRETVVHAIRREAAEELLSNADDAGAEQLSHLTYLYPYEGEQDIRTKVSVSELKHQAMLFAEGEAEELDWVKKTEHPHYVPSFASDGSEENKGALRGSAVHRVMECLDFTKIGGFLSWDRAKKKAWVETALEEMRSDGRITAEMKALVSPQAIQRFLESELAARMHEAAKKGVLYKEKPFVLGLPASEVYHKESDETVLVQGIIDVFFAEEGQYVIMDYKTDRVAHGQQLIDRYQTQLDLYADAVSRNRRAPVKEKLIYSFHLGETVAL